jgi:late competence protein required for DNA uptake (superfamily II DNA/RNA helicase)
MPYDGRNTMPASTTTTRTNRRSKRVTCSRCGKTATQAQASRHFARNKRNASGFGSACKSCITEARKAKAS